MKTEIKHPPFGYILKRSSAVDSVFWILVEDEGKVVSGSGLKSLDDCIKFTTPHCQVCPG